MMYYLKEGIIYNQIGKENIVKKQQNDVTIFLNETASVIFRAIVDEKNIEEEILRKYELKKEEFEIVALDVKEVLNNLMDLGVIYEE